MLNSPFTRSTRLGHQSDLCEAQARLASLERQPVRLIARVDTGLVYFDHVVAIVVFGHRGNNRVEVHYAMPRFGPEPLGGGESS